jgi:hypothetical protein
LHTLHLPNLLVLGVSPCEVLLLVASFPTSPSTSKTESVCIFYRVFEFGGFTGSFLKEVFISSYLVFYLLLLLRFYGLHCIDIFLSFSKSPSLLKSESRRESYRIFCEVFFCWFRARVGPEIQPEINRKPSGLISSMLGLNRKFNREFPVQPRIQPGIQPEISGPTGNSTGNPVSPQTASFL